jgi:competence protein ComEA
MAQMKRNLLPKIRELFERAGWGPAFPQSLAVFAFIGIVVIAVVLIRYWPSHSTGDVYAVNHESVQETDSSSNEPSASVVVDVAGAVQTPGVYTLTKGSRVHEALLAAGGPTEDATTNSINLARILIDAEQIYVPHIDETTTPTTTSAPSKSKSTGFASLVNINTADIDALCTLSGIGEATAQKIIDDRIANGPFMQPDDLMRVSGIGEKKYAQIQDKICV